MLAEPPQLVALASERVENIPENAAQITGTGRREIKGLLGAKIKGAITSSDVRWAAWSRSSIAERRGIDAAHSPVAQRVDSESSAADAARTADLGTGMASAMTTFGLAALLGGCGSAIAGDTASPPEPEFTLAAFQAAASAWSDCALTSAYRLSFAPATVSSHDIADGAMAECSPLQGPLRRLSKGTRPDAEIDADLARLATLIHDRAFAIVVERRARN